MQMKPQERSVAPALGNLDWALGALRAISRLLAAAVAVLLLVGALLRWDKLGALSDPRWQLILTLAGLAVGTWFASIQVRGQGRFPKTAFICLVGILLSQALYLLLVWTSLKMRPTLWAAWWLSLVAAATATHIVWLRLSSPADRRGVVRGTVICALLAGVTLAALALRRNILAMPGLLYFGALGVFAAGSILGSLVLWRRMLRQQERPVPRAVKIGWSVVVQAIVISVAFYAGRITAPLPGVADGLPSALAHLDEGQIDRQVRADLARLRIIDAGLNELEAKVASFSRRARAARQAQGRTIYTPAEEDELRRLFMAYLAYRDALLRMVATYAGFEAVGDEAAKARCLLVGYAAGATLYDASLKLIEQYKDDGPARKKLNEPEPRWGMPAGLFDRIHANVLNDRNIESLAEVGAYYNSRRAAWSAADVFSQEDLSWLTSRIDAAAVRITAGRPGHVERLEHLAARVRRDAYTPVYAVQSVVSTWIGDTRLVHWQPLIRHEQIAEMRHKLQPGDILLERRNWFLSNAFLPGFWPHAALYIGTPEDLAKLGLLRRERDQWTSNHPEIRRHLPRYLAAAHDGHPHTVIESISDGVVFNSMAESMHADHVAALRPRLSDRQKADAILKAFSHLGKPYDFEFDFATSDKLVCTELVWRAYDGSLSFRTEPIAGRETLPALAIARKFRDERDSPGRQLDLILFLDGSMTHGRAVLADEAAFCASCERPQGFNE